MSLTQSNAWEASLVEDKQAKAAWDLKRSKGLGGSEIGIIMGVSPYKTAYELWEEKTGRRLPEDISNLPHVRRGIIGETQCRALLEEKYATKYVPTMWNKGDVLRCSDDGYSADLNQILEIKCMGREAHDNVALCKIPEIYSLQCQWNMYVSGATSCLFVSYHPEDTSWHELVLVPNVEEQESLAEFAINWWDKYITRGVEHPRSSADYKQVRSASFTDTATAYRLLKARHEQDEIDLERLKEILAKELSDTSPAVMGGGVKISKSLRKGTIDYAKIEAIKHIDLEKYRRPSTWVTTVRVDSAT